MHVERRSQQHQVQFHLSTNGTAASKQDTTEPPCAHTLRSVQQLDHAAKHAQAHKIEGWHTACHQLARKLGKSSKGWGGRGEGGIGETSTAR